MLVLKIVDCPGVTFKDERFDMALIILGRYLVDFNPLAEKDEDVVVTSETIDGAKKFDSMHDAWHWINVEHEYGTRSDGLPNRPLRALTLEMIPVD